MTIEGRYFKVKEVTVSRDDPLFGDMFWYVQDVRERGMSGPMVECLLITGTGRSALPGRIMYEPLDVFMANVKKNTYQFIPSTQEASIRKHHLAYLDKLREYKEKGGRDEK